MRVVAPTPVTERSAGKEVASIAACYQPGSVASTAAASRLAADAAQQSPPAELPQEPSMHAAEPVRSLLRLFQQQGNCTFISLATGCSRLNASSLWCRQMLIRKRPECWCMGIAGHSHQQGRQQERRDHSARCGVRQPTMAKPGCQQSRPNSCAQSASQTAPTSTKARR